MEATSQVMVPLDPELAAVAHCAVSVRGCTAARVLAQAGYSVRNPDGGHKTWFAGMSPCMRTPTHPRWMGRRTEYPGGIRLGRSELGGLLQPQLLQLVLLRLRTIEQLLELRLVQTVVIDFHENPPPE